MSIFPGGRLIPRVAEATFMMFVPEEIDRQKWRRAIDDIVPTACLQLGQTLHEPGNRRRSR
jgi:hypothetical protein